MAVATARCHSIRVVLMVLWIINMEIKEVDVLVAVLMSEGHDHVRKHANSLIVARFNEGNEIGVCRRRDISFRITEIVIRREEMGRVVTPLAFKKTVRRWEQFDRVDAELH